eukprot:Skav236693  [mRNA]  locus=scaffold847:329297:333620:- [translate_table: standard]
MRNADWASFSSPGELGMRLREGIINGCLPKGMEDFFNVKHNASSGATKLKKGLFPLPVDFSVDHNAMACSEREAAASPWLPLVCHGLNTLAGCELDAPPQRKGQQHEWLRETLVDRINRFNGMFTPQSLEPSVLWSDFKNKKLSYDGEEISPPEMLTLDRILKTLPPPGHGGSVDLVPLLEGKARHLMLHPEEVVLPEDLREPGALTARVHIREHEALDVWKLLEDRGIIEWLPLGEVFGTREGPYLSGLFGVEKPGRFNDQGQTLLRVIMNLQPINRALRIIKGDIDLLPMASLWTQLTLDQDEILDISQADMASAFYLFRLPRCWLPYLCFNAKFRGSRLNRAGNQYFVPACRVLPMGWTSSVGLMQMASRELIRRIKSCSAPELRRFALAPAWFVDLARRTGDEHFWQVYLDNYMSCGVSRKDSPKHHSVELHSQAMAAWDSSGVLSAPDKHVLGESSAVELGVAPCGDHGLVGGGPQRLQKLLSLTLLMIGLHKPKVKWVQMLLGRWIFVLQYRRPAMSILSQSWNYCLKGADRDLWWPTVKKELCTLLCVVPLLHHDLRMKFSNVTTCSDASLWGGAMASAESLSGAGCQVLDRLTNPNLEPKAADLLVISAFNGIGGAFRGYDLAGVKPLALIAIEWDKAAQRVTRSAWPQVIEVNDIEDVTLDTVREWHNSFPRVSHVHIIGGFPCVHLSRVRWGRRNLEGEGSRLFWTLRRLIKWVESTFAPLATVEYLIENVASMDTDARTEISQTLEIEPLMLCPSDLLCYNRPRLAWCSTPVVAGDGISLVQMDGYTKVEMSGPALDLEQWIAPGWKPTTPGKTFPTFMKAIPRWAPPPQPAGLARCRSLSRERWASDNFRFPPYQYCYDNLLRNEDGDLRYLNSSERELLLGFGFNHTLFAMSANDAKHRDQDLEDKRLSLCGDSFSMLSFGWIISQMCKTWEKPRSPAQIIQRFGLAPGASLAANFEAPLRIGISPQTEARYASALAAVLPALELAASIEDLDVLCEEWIEHEWERGTPLSVIGDALCSLHFHWPQVKGQLRGSWKLYRNWRRIEVPQRAPPMPRVVCQALIGWLLHREALEMAFLCAVGFHAYVRTGELLKLHYDHIHLTPTAGAITIGASKSGLRFNIEESVRILDPTIFQLWELLLVKHQGVPGGTIWPASGTSFRSLFAEALFQLGLLPQKFQPYSLRRGGATHHFAIGTPLDAILIRGRWRSLAVARLYLQDGHSQLTQISLSSSAWALINRFSSGFPPEFLA